MLFFILSSPQSLLKNRYIFASGRKEWKNFIILFYFIKKNLTILSVQVLQIDMFMACSPCF